MRNHKIINLLLALSLFFPLLLPVTSVSAADGQEQLYNLSFHAENPTQTTIDLSITLDGPVGQTETITYYINYGPYTEVAQYSSQTQVVTVDDLEPNTAYDFEIEAIQNEEVIAKADGVAESTLEAPPAPRYFEDPALEDAVRSQLGMWDLSTSLVDSDIEKLEELYGSLSEITSLKGLENAKNLKSLIIPNNKI
ncbi:fibronectin type III domain-containing protein [Fredinandcohnia onubensis]|uniref:fibronectin type III domain-containing protein n=1 Tax=Fredinandcohnia onubensis TaxID=1571209 RepID=UPI000C0BF7BF|nr:fibronectin type III domain-containing protein [Fredinandcohnia onubensis]